MPLSSFDCYLLNFNDGITGCNGTLSNVISGIFGGHPEDRWWSPLTCKLENLHFFKFRLLQPLPHPPEGLPARFQFTPRFGVP